VEVPGDDRVGPKAKCRSFTLNSAKGRSGRSSSVMVEHRAVVLVSPLGLSPGAVFSALWLTCPEHVILVSGAAAAGGAPAALAEYQRVSKRRPSVEYVLLDDALGGFAEAQAAALGVAARFRTEECEVAVNLTGGTTALQYCVTCIGMALGRARFVAVVDERSRELQLREPYVSGKLVEVPRPITRD
jgi:hypothetical protein